MPLKEINRGERRERRERIPGFLTQNPSPRSRRSRRFIPLLGARTGRNPVKVKFIASSGDRRARARVCVRHPEKSPSPRRGSRQERKGVARAGVPRARASGLQINRACGTAADRRAAVPLPAAPRQSGKSKVHCIIGGIAGTQTRACFRRPEKSPSPRRGERGIKEEGLSHPLSTAWRVGPQGGRAAPPAATFRRPVGAETAHSAGAWEFAKKTRRAGFET
jgi:hypothetical protein